MLANRRGEKSVYKTKQAAVKLDVRIETTSKVEEILFKLFNSEGSVHVFIQTMKISNRFVTLKRITTILGFHRKISLYV